MWSGFCASPGGAGDTRAEKGMITATKCDFTSLCACDCACGKRASDPQHDPQPKWQHEDHEPTVHNRSNATLRSHTQPERINEAKTKEGGGKKYKIKERRVTNWRWKISLCYFRKFLLLESKVPQPFRGSLRFLPHPLSPSPPPLVMKLCITHEKWQSKSRSLLTLASH